MGKGDNWQDMLSYTGTTTAQGRWGFSDIVLDDAELQPGGETDLLIHFNSSPLIDEAGHYSINPPRQLISSKYYVYGNGGGAFQGERNKKILIPGENNLFSPGTVSGDFTIEFFIYPATLGNREILLSWEGSMPVENKLRHQSFSCSIRDRRLFWRFDNFFYSPTTKNTQFQLTGLTPMIPKRWYHHMLRFDSTTGLMEYLVNGVLEAVIFVTDSQTEGSDINLPYTGNVSTGDLILCGNYNGFMDELSISRKFKKEPSIHKYKDTHGKIISRIFDLEYSGTEIKNINAVYSKPAATEIYFYYKTADTLYTWDTLGVPWVQFDPTSGFPESVKGKYLQLSAELYPDGNAEHSPAISSIEIIYEQDLPPSPPAEVMIIPGNESVTLKWQQVNEYDVTGYYVYYGNHSGIYTGMDNSPVDAGKLSNIEITGLENGKLYYFAVVTYDSATPPHSSIFSKEVSARPSVLNK